MTDTANIPQAPPLITPTKVVVPENNATRLSELLPPRLSYRLGYRRLTDTTNKTETTPTPAAPEPNLSKQEVTNLIEKLNDVLKLFETIHKEGNAPCTTLKFKLNVLQTVTGETPRSELLNKDKKKEDTKKDKAPSTTSTGYWARGTGYGYGGESSSWDPEKHKDEQDKKGKAIAVCLDEICKELKVDSLPSGLAASLDESCLIPMMESYLRNDSIVEMERQGVLYGSILTLITCMMKHKETARLFLPLQGQITSLQMLIKELGKQARLFAKLSEAKITATGSKTEEAKAAENTTVAQQVLEAASLVHKTLEQIAIEDAKNSKDNKGKSTDQKTVESKKEEIKADLTNWSKLMKNMRFGEIKEFRAHNFLTTAKDQNTTPQRAFMRRLQSEYSDLRKSLPLEADSSIFVRVKEDNLSLAQMLVTAPVDTPYSRGCFLFDVFFPNDYPNTPPKVNLQTTGQNTFRFNPNLYANGYVCLSLLNTWNGSKEERWNPKTSTFLQVCVSLQSLVLIPHPYFNEPGWTSQMNTPSGKTASDNYNSNVRNATIKFAMLEMIEKPPLGFEYIVHSHFYLQKANIIKQCEGWLTDGISIGANLEALKPLVEQLKTALNKLEMPKAPKLDAEDD